MSRVKLTFAILALAAVCLATQAQAAVTVEVAIAGSSAMWQTLALGAYNEAGAGAGHWTSASNVINLTDSRTTPVNVDPGTLWVVWNAAATEVWAFTKVDSVVGNRCYFAQPACSLNGTSANLSGTGANQISSTLWGDGSSDTALPASVLSLFTTGTPITVAATDIRPEDANFAICRVNSQLGAGSAGGTASDGLDGLGYNSNWQPGACATSGSASSAYVGNPIKSALPGSTSVANVVSFNIKGNDPISGTKIPNYTVYEVGATPVVFVFSRSNSLKGLSNVTTQQLQQAFSGTNCDATAFDLAAGSIGIFLREPLSGTYNTTEATIMRHPTVYPGDILGVSMESNVNGGTNNPLNGQSSTCLNGTGGRYRGIGTSDEVNWVANSNKDISMDGIGYTFFSYGNVKALANSNSFGYATLNNIDPIFASYGPQSSTGAGFDPGQPPNSTNTTALPGTVPGSANTPCGSFPCSEGEIWAGGLSFPNVRSGAYPAWSLVRLVATTGSKSLTAAEALVKKSQAFVVTTTPDYIPAIKTVGGSITDPGLQLVRSHYQQYDGAGTLLGAAPVDCGTTEAGGDMGGVIIPFVSAKCVTGSATQEVQGNQGLQVRPTNP
jgi:hypothetical protein